MVKTIIMVLYFIFLLLSIYNIIRKYRLAKVINATISFQVAFVLYYVLIPLISLIILQLNVTSLNGMLLRISNMEDIDIIYAFIFTVIFYAIFLFSYRIKNFSKLTRRYSQSNTSKKLNNDTSNLATPDNKKYRTAIIWGLSCLLLGLLSQLLIVDSLGGIQNAAMMGDHLRSFGGNNDRFIPSSRLFALTLMPITLASPYFFVYAKRLKNGVILKILLLISLMSSVLYFLINAGRIAILIFILSFFIDIIFNKTKHPFIYIIFISMLLLLLLNSLNALFFYLSYGFALESNNTGIISIINEFAFPYLNLLNILNINEIYNLRYGVDFVAWVINIIPHSILQLFGQDKIKVGYHIITEYYLGTNPGGGIPTDVITLGMRQFGILGLIMTPLFLGRILNIIDNVIKKIHDKNYYFATLRVSSIAFLLLPYADVDSFIRNRFDMIIVLLFLIHLKHIKNMGFYQLPKRRLQNEL